jgi:hypothetical protein
MPRKPTSTCTKNVRPSDAPFPQDANTVDGAPHQNNNVDESAGRPEVVNQDDSKAPYSVGYCRPPKHSQFKPGQSGNPKGRLKQSRNLRTVVKQVLDEDMLIREGTRLRRMPAAEALVRTTMTRALKGEPKAVASLLILIRQAGYGSDHDECGADLLATPEINAIVEDFIARYGSKETPMASEDEGKSQPPADVPPPKPKE